MMHIQMRTRQRIDEESAIFNDGLRRPDGLPQSCYVIFEWWKARAEKNCTNIIQNLELGGINEDVCLKMRMPLL